MRDIEIVPEDSQFGLMTWRLLSREVDEGGQPTTIVKALAIMGLGIYIRTYHRVGMEWRVDEPLLLKNVLMVELMEIQSAGLLDAAQQPMGTKFKCLNREVISIDEARRRFAPKGPKSMPPGIELYPGAILTQERRPMPMNIARGPLAVAPPPDAVPPHDAPAEATSAP